MMEIKDISLSFDGRKILDGINFKLEENEILGLVGDSGSGKTSLSKLILGLVRPDTGQVIYDGVNLAGLSPRQYRPYRKDIQIISQNPSSFFDPSMKLGKSVIQPLRNFKLDLNLEKLNYFIDEFKVDEKLLDRYPHQVSGGEIQRLAIIRALLLEPKILILDEATSMLDISVQAQIIGLLKAFQEENSMSYIFISHDMDLVEIFSHRILRLENGIIK